MPFGKMALLEGIGDGLQACIIQSDRAHVFLILDRAFYFRHTGAADVRRVETPVASGAVL